MSKLLLLFRFFRPVLLLSPLLLLFLQACSSSTKIIPTAMTNTVAINNAVMNSTTSDPRVFMPCKLNTQDACRQQAEYYYQQAAQKALDPSKLKRVYREVARLYQHAADLYQPYGTYKDASLLAKHYQALGMVNIYIDADSDNAVLASMNLPMILDEEYINWVDNKQLANVVFKLQYHVQFSHNSTPSRLTSAEWDSLPVTNSYTPPAPPSGAADLYSQIHANRLAYVAPVRNRNYTYEQNIVVNQNLIELEAKLILQGDIDLTRKYSFTSTSKEINTSRLGDPPPGTAKFSREGQLLSQDQLNAEAITELQRKIYQDIATIVQQISHL